MWRTQRKQKNEIEVEIEGGWKKLLSLYEPYASSLRLSLSQQDGDESMKDLQRWFLV